MFSNSTNDLGICCNTWPKDAHGLFDYESETINKMEKTLGKGGKITRDSELNETQYYPTKQPQSPSPIPNPQSPIPLILI